MIVIAINKAKKILLICLGLLIFGGGVMFYREELMQTSAKVQNYCIVVDAGHGKPDGGAVSKSGVEEEALNLAIALKLRNKLEQLGYEVIMTRETNDNIASLEEQSSLREMKTADLTKRVQIANESKADFMISIHMNEYTNSTPWGWQTFYSKDSEEGKTLAILVQKTISKYIDRPNKRTALPIEGIKIVDKTILPVIIVECGFLSNAEDLQLLQTEEYQAKLVDGMVEAIENYYDT